MRLFLILLLVSVVTSAASFLNASSTFLQLNATLFAYHNSPYKSTAWPLLPFNQSVKQILFVDESIFVLLLNGGQVWNADPRGLAAGRTTTFLWIGQVDATCKMIVAEKAPVFKGASLVVACGPKVGVCSIGSIMSPVLKCNWWNTTIAGQIQNVAVSYSEDPNLMLATDHGLFAFSFQSGTCTAVPLTNATGSLVLDLNVTSVFCLPLSESNKATEFQGGRCFAASTASPWGLLHVVRDSIEVYVNRMPGIFDAIPTAAVFDTIRRAIHFGNTICLNQMFGNGTLRRVDGPHGGLPHANITSAAESLSGTPGNIVWFGTTAGICALMPDNSWKYLFGPRWLPSSAFSVPSTMSILAIAGASDAALAATPTGLTFIQSLTWTLDQKAQHVQSIVHPRHDYFGLFNDVHLQSWGDVRSYVKGPGANDGLWTSLYLASQSLRYGATGEEEARLNAWTAFRGMRGLINVTGIRGLPARSLKITNTSPGPDWHPSLTMPGFWWWGDTSSDEITGHLSAYPLMYDLIARTAEEKKEVATTIDDIAGYIVENNFTLVDVTGKPTTWGHWEPQLLDLDYHWYHERGLNALEIISYMCNAYRVTNDVKYHRALEFLVDGNSYDEDSVNQKMVWPYNVNYSDDELAFLPYLAILWSRYMPGTKTENPCFTRVSEKIRASLKRTLKYVRREKAAPWNLIYAAWFADEADADFYVRDAVWCLQTYTISWVDWPVDNSRRSDILSSKYYPTTQSDNVLPYDETTFMRWNGCPFSLGQGGGSTEFDPGAWLYPYWIGRYFELIK